MPSLPVSLRFEGITGEMRYRGVSPRISFQDLVCCWLAYLIPGVMSRNIFNLCRLRVRLRSHPQALCTSPRPSRESLPLHICSFTRGGYNLF